jgi:hypothetical protein
LCSKLLHKRAVRPTELPCQHIIALVLDLMDEDALTDFLVILIVQQAEAPAKIAYFIIQGKCGIQLFHDVLDPDFRRGDQFLLDHKN